MVSLGIMGQSKYMPTQVRVGYDLSSLVNTLANSDKTFFEVTADIDFDRYFVTMDYGIQERTRQGDDFLYKNRGSYFRIGPEVNFNHRDRRNSSLFLGFRYATAVFDDEMSYMIQDDVFGEFSGFSSNDRLNAEWLELVSGLKVKIWDQLFLGYTVRFKFAKSQDLSENLAPYDIPGYGRVDQDTAWGFNYYVFYRFKLREIPDVPERKERKKKNKKEVEDLDQS